MSQERSVVVKIGGSTLGSTDTTLADVARLASAGRSVVVVHGGGNRISEALAAAGVGAEFVDGLRATSPEAMPVVARALDSVNDEIAARVIDAGLGVAVFSSSQPAFRAQPIPALGRVGEVTGVCADAINRAIDRGDIPLIACLALDDEGFLNVNGDTAAGEVAIALQASDLVFLTNVEGVLSREGELLPILHIDDAALLLSDGTAGGGMAPKLRASMKAAANGISTAILDGRAEGALSRYLFGQPGGTRIGVAGAPRP